MIFFPFRCFLIFRALFFSLAMLFISPFSFSISSHCFLFIIFHGFGHCFTFLFDVYGEKKSINIFITTFFSARRAIKQGDTMCIVPWYKHLILQPIACLCICLSIDQWMFSVPAHLLWLPCYNLLFIQCYFGSIL